MNNNDFLMIPKRDLDEIPNYSGENMKIFLEAYNADKIFLFIQKDKAYGGSWQKDGVLSAFFNLKRKIDRILAQFKNGTLHTFADKSKDTGGETPLDTFMDLENYSAMNVAFKFFKINNVVDFDYFCDKIPSLKDKFEFFKGEIRTKQ